MPSLPLSRRRALAGATLLLAVQFVPGRQLAGAGTSTAPQQAAPLERVRGATAVEKLVDHVVGAVRRPGLYRFPDGSRVAEAVARAGGATKAADLALLNLAAPLTDGAQVVVPRGAPVGVTSGAASGTGSGAATPPGPVSLNAATLEQLDALPGVGPSTAQKILDYRTEHGAFGSVDELDAVPGIGPARLEQLRELVVP